MIVELTIIRSLNCTLKQTKLIAIFVTIVSRIRKNAK